MIKKKPPIDGELGDGRQIIIVLATKMWIIPMRSPWYPQKSLADTHSAEIPRWKEVATLSTYILVALVVLDLAFLCAFFCVCV